MCPLSSCINWYVSVISIMIVPVIRNVLVSSAPSEFVMQKCPLDTSVTSVSLSCSFWFSHVILCSFDKVSQKLFLCFCVVVVTPTSSVVLVTVPSQPQEAPPDCAAMMLSAWVAASCVVMLGWYCLACWGSPDQVPW